MKSEEIKQKLSEDLDIYIEDKFKEFNKEVLKNNFINFFINLLEKEEFKINNIDDYKIIYRSLRKLYFKKLQLSISNPKIVCLTSFSDDKYNDLKNNIEKELGLEIELIKEKEQLLKNKDKYDIIIINEQYYDCYEKIKKENNSFRFILNYSFKSISLDILQEYSYLGIGEEVTTNYLLNDEEYSTKFSLAKECCDRDYTNDYYNRKKKVLKALIETSLGMYYKNIGLDNHYKTFEEHHKEYEESSKDIIKKIERRVKTLSEYKAIERIARKYLFLVQQKCIHVIPHNVKVKDDYNSIQIDIMEERQIIASLNMFNNRSDDNDYKTFKLAYKKPDGKLTATPKYGLYVIPVHIKETLPYPPEEIQKYISLIYKKTIESLMVIIENGNQKYNNKIYTKKSW